MTGTERASHPHALVRDRAVSRNRRDKSMQKGGAGAHNWGSFQDERELEAGAEYDENLEFDEELQDSWTGDAEAAPVTEEQSQEMRAAATLADTKVTLVDIARTSKGAQFGKAQDTIPVASDANTAIDSTFERK